MSNLVLTYYYGKAKYVGYSVPSEHEDFKHVIELNDVDENQCDCEDEAECTLSCVVRNIDFFYQVYRAYDIINQTVGIESENFEIFCNKEEQMIRIFFKNEGDAMLFKLYWYQ